MHDRMVRGARVPDEEHVTVGHVELARATGKLPASLSVASRGKAVHLTGQLDL